MLTDDEAEQLRLIRIGDVLKLVPVSERTLYRMMDRGEFPQPTKRGGLLLWNFQKVKAWAEGGSEQDDEDII